jgi:hypothetical protein
VPGIYYDNEEEYYFNEAWHQGWSSLVGKSDNLVYWDHTARTPHILVSEVNVPTGWPHAYLNVYHYDDLGGNNIFVLYLTPLTWGYSSTG